MLGLASVQPFLSSSIIQLSVEDEILRGLMVARNLLRYLHQDRVLSVTSSPTVLSARFRLTSAPHQPLFPLFRPLSFHSSVSSRWLLSWEQYHSNWAPRLWMTTPWTSTLTSTWTQMWIQSPNQNLRYCSPAFTCPVSSSVTSGHSSDISSSGGRGIRVDPVHRTDTRFFSASHLQ